MKVTAEELFGVRTDLTAHPLATRRTELDSQDVGSVVQAMDKLVRRLTTGQGTRSAPRVEGIGVAISGDVDGHTGVVHRSPFLNWQGVPLARLVEEATGLPTVIENDVRALTVAEQWSGAGAGLSSFAVVTVGTGIGAGLSIGGKVVSGAHGVAGEVGHLPVGGDRMCTCGNVGCVESIAATQAIVEQARQAAGDPKLTMADAVRLARGGNRQVLAVFTRAARALGLAIAAVANLIGPERIIISGEGVAFYDLFAEQIRETFTAQAFGAAKDCDLIVRPLPFEEWARGGAAVAAQNLVVPTRPRYGSVGCEEYPHMKIVEATAYLADIAVETVRTDAVQSFIKQETVFVDLVTDDGTAGPATRTRSAPAARPCSRCSART